MKKNFLLYGITWNGDRVNISMHTTFKAGERKAEKLIDSGAFQHYRRLTVQRVSNIATEFSALTYSSN